MPDYSLTTGGWIIMVTSVACVLSLAGYCLFRVLNLPAVEMDDIEGPLTIDTGDTEDAD